MTANGLVTIACRHSVRATIDRLESEVKAKGMTVFARVDHAAGAKEAGLELRPTKVLIFGSAKAGTPLMQADQTIGIDLPLKVLVWQDAAGKTWISYNDPDYLAVRHRLGDGFKPFRCLHGIKIASDRCQSIGCHGTRSCNGNNH